MKILIISICNEQNFCLLVLGKKNCIPTDCNTRNLELHTMIFIILPSFNY